MQEPIDFTGLTIPTLEGGREPVVGPYTASMLAQLFTSSWVPYLECQECGRHSYCKFTKPHPYPEPRRAGRLAEIRCGVVKTMIMNYVRGVFPLLQEMSARDLQKFLDGSYHLVSFVYDAELHIGRTLSDGFIDWLGNERYRAMFFGSTARLRRHLDCFAGQFRDIEVFHTKTTVILTEGPSEKAFLQKLAESGIVGLTDLDVQSYYGQGNRGPKNLRLLANRLHDEGYDLFIQGDCDAQIRNLFQSLVEKGIVDSDNTFAFDLDFESSFPTNLFYAALCAVEALSGVAFDDFDTKLARRPREESVMRTIAREWQVEVNKIELAEALGTELNRRFLLFLDDSFWSSEIGGFLNKIRGLP